MSGGVDSSVTALLLKEQGHNVFGIFMQNWDDENDPHCSAEQDLTDARRVADQIGIELHTVNFSQNYWDQVFSHCLDEFRAGRTPNPDVLCNREIKFNVLLDHALALGADKLATGHYARIQTDANGAHELLKGLDEQKDQSYFLYLLNREQLRQSLFPLGEYKKPEIRKIAAKYKLATKDKKDSTGICFIGERRFKDFLSEFILAKPGLIEDEAGQVIGRHDGTMFYTIGQRKGLHIGGRKDAGEAAWYVLEKDVQRNALIVGQGSENPKLYKSSLRCEALHWISPPDQQILPAQAKTRYRQDDQACSIHCAADQTATVHFEQPQRAVTPGQSVVFYQGDRCLGGGIIST